MLVVKVQGCIVDVCIISLLCNLHIVISTNACTDVIERVENIPHFVLRFGRSNTKRVVWIWAKGKASLMESKYVDYGLRH